MRMLHDRHGVQLFLFQDEFFLNSKERVGAFCQALKGSGLVRAGVKWKAFARINLTDDAVLDAMSSSGCVEIRYGIESGSDRILERTAKGFTIADATRVVSEAVKRFPRVDTFFIWGFPFETMEDFHKTVFQNAISFASTGRASFPRCSAGCRRRPVQENKDKAQLSAFQPPHLCSRVHAPPATEIVRTRPPLRLGERHAHQFRCSTRGTTSGPNFSPGFFRSPKW
jgi:hypothetical protein